MLVGVTRGGGYCGVGDQKGELCVLREKKISKQKGEMVAVSVT